MGPADHLHLFSITSFKAPISGPDTPHGLELVQVTGWCSSGFFIRNLHTTDILVLYKYLSHSFRECVSQYTISSFPFQLILFFTQIHSFLYLSIMTSDRNQKDYGSFTDVEANQADESLKSLEISNTSDLTTPKPRSPSSEFKYV